MTSEESRYAIEMYHLYKPMVLTPLRKKFAISAIKLMRWF